MNNLPLVSIVIPVFNEEKYLSICIESVLSQFYTNYECIIVDNCSTDSSLQIAKYYQQCDRRIIVKINNHYLSLLENHNKSLQYISPRSKYCKMVLGDDFIFSDCIEKMVDIAESYQNIGIVGSYRLLGNEVAGIGLPIAENPKGYSVFNGKKISKLQLLRGDIYLFGTQTTVMYRSDYVRNRTPFFNESSIYFGDAEVCYEILKDHDFGFINQILSYTRTDNSSLSTSILDFRPTLSAKMEFLHKYAEYYLDENEYVNRYNSLLNEYYDYLGWKVFTQRKIAFWKFHESELFKVGVKINKLRLFIHAVKYFINIVLNPKNTIEIMINKNKSKKNRIYKNDIPNLYSYSR